MVKGTTREDEVRIKVANTFCKTLEYFGSQREYDDYLEEMEDIIYCLVNNENYKQAEEKLSQYEAANRALIVELSIKREEEKKLERQRITEEIKHFNRRLHQYQEEDKEKAEIENEKQKIEIYAVTGSDTNAKKRALEERENSIARKRRKLERQKAKEEKDTEASAPRLQLNPMANRPLPQVMRNATLMRSKEKSSPTLQKEAAAFSINWLVGGMVMEMLSSLEIPADPMDTSD